jgi:hypothetical protein
MSEEAAGENKNVIQQMDKLKKRFGKIRDIHIDKQKNISNLTRRKINQADQEKLAHFDVLLAENRTQLKPIKHQISVLITTYDSDKDTLDVEERKVETLKTELKNLAAKIKGAEDAIPLGVNFNASLTQILTNLKEEKAKRLEAAELAAKAKLPPPKPTPAAAAAAAADAVKAKATPPPQNQTPEAAPAPATKNKADDDAARSQPESYYERTKRMFGLGPGAEKPGDEAAAVAVPPGKPPPPEATPEAAPKPAADAAAARLVENEEEEAAAKLKEKDAEAAAKQKAGEEAAAKQKNAEEEAAAKQKKTDEEAAAKQKKTDEEAAARQKEKDAEAAETKKKADEEATAKQKKADEEEVAKQKKADEEAAAKQKEKDAEVAAEKLAAANLAAEEKETARKAEEKETAREKAAEEAAAKLAALAAAGGDPANTDTNLDLLQLSDADLKEICVEKRIVLSSNPSASTKMRMILENGDRKFSDYIAKKYNITELDFTKRTQQILKLRYTIETMKNFKTAAFTDFAAKYKLNLPKDSKTLEMVANELQLKSPLERSVITEELLYILGVTSKKTQFTTAQKYQIDGVENNATKTLFQNLKTLLEVHLDKYMDEWVK